MPRETRKVIAEETMEIIAHEGYICPKTGTFTPVVALKHAVENAEYYPERKTFETESAQNLQGRFVTRFEVTREKTLVTIERLIKDEGEDSKTVAVLNFASARSPGGGFLSGSDAQEESLARTTALYATLTTTTTQQYYRDNERGKSRGQGSLRLAYTHGIIWSPLVPVLRCAKTEQLLHGHCVYTVSFITAPAVNRSQTPPGKASGKTTASENNAAANDVMAERIRRILAVAKYHGQQVLVLGAFGCGVFRNDPSTMAELFHRQLHAPESIGVFRRVVFAIHVQASVTKDPNLLAFQEAFSPRTRI